MAGAGVVRGFLAIVAAVVAIAAWYWASPWPVALGAAFVALAALDLAFGTARHSALLWSLSRPARPLQMRWSLSVVLTERALETLGVPVEVRPELQRHFGEYAPAELKQYLFKGHPAPAWISRPVTVSYERWGESLERWTIANTWGGWVRGEPSTHHEKRTFEFLPEVDKTEIVDLWGYPIGVHFRYQDGRLIFLDVDLQNVSHMPDGRLSVKEGARVLFDMPTPTLSMSRGDWRQADERNPLAKFIASDPAGDGLGPRYYHRHGKEQFQCEDWDRGFRWDLEVNDLRRGLSARVRRVPRSLLRRQVKWISVELEGSGVRFVANPLVVEPTTEGRCIPKKNERVEVVLNDEGAVDRIWLQRW